jgi:cytochrome oxidase Cu insertion factor (SCO1/SenC/PrrC family)
MRLKLLGILAVCAAPVVASYLAYYVIKPGGRSNYGELIEPQRPVATLAVIGPDGAAAGMDRFRGKWVLLTTAERACDAACAQRLYVMRQVRLTTGRDRDRIERVLLITDGSTPAAALLAEHEGLQVLRADPSALSAGGLPPAEAAARAADLRHRSAGQPDDAFPGPGRSRTA